MTSNILAGSEIDASIVMDDLNKSLGEYLDEIIAENPNKICLLDATRKNQLTVSEIAIRSRNLAVRLQSLGCQNDTIVGIISQNRMEYFIIILASIYAGTIVTCFNPLYTIGELEHTINVSNPTVLFCSSDSVEKVKQIHRHNSAIKHIVIIDEEYEEWGNELLFSNLIKQTDQQLKAVKKEPNDTVLILYSSGTTGYPKGVMLTHQNYVFTLTLCRHENFFDYGGQYTIGILPIFHCYGLFLYFLALGIVDLTLIIMKKFERSTFLNLIQEYKVETLFAVPPIALFLLKNPMVHEYDISSLKQIISAGAPLQEKAEIEIEKSLNIDSVWQMYGLTETTICSISRVRHKKKRGSIGAPINGTQAKIVDLDTRETLGPGTRGELLLKGPHVMKGYYKNSKATADSMDEVGWLMTGDIAYYDNDGYIFIVDRLKELIKCNGYQVAPAELEDLLLKHKEVQEAAVIGIPHDTAGEIPKAFVKRQPSSEVTEKELVEYIAGLVSPQKRLQGGVIFLDEIPKSPSGKILRRKLKEQYAQFDSVFQ